MQLKLLTAAQCGLANYCYASKYVRVPAALNLSDFPVVVPHIKTSLSQRLICVQSWAYLFLLSYTWNDHTHEKASQHVFVEYRIPLMSKKFEIEWRLTALDIFHDKLPSKFLIHMKNHLFLNHDPKYSHRPKNITKYLFDIWIACSWPFSPAIY